MDAQHAVDAANVVEHGEEVRRRAVDVEAVEARVATDVIEAVYCMRHRDDRTSARGGAVRKVRTGTSRSGARGRGPGAAPGDAPLAEKSDAPSGMRRYEKHEEFAPSVAARQVGNA